MDDNSPNTDSPTPDKAALPTRPTNENVSPEDDRRESPPGTKIAGEGLSGLGSSAFWRYVNLGASSIEGLFIAGFALRKLGTTGYGTYAVAAATIALIVTVDFGLSLTVIRSVAQDTSSTDNEQRNEARQSVASAHTAYATLAVASLLVTGLVIWVLPHITKGHSATGQQRLTYLLVGAAVALSLATSAFDGIPSGRRKFSIPALATVAGASSNVIVVIATIGKLHIVALGWGELAGVLVTRLVGACWLVARERWFRLWPTRTTLSQLRQVMAFAAPLLVLSIGGQLIATSDLIVVGAVVSVSAVAVYRVGSMAPGQLITLLFTGSDAVFPALVGSNSPKAQEDAVAFISKVLCFVSGILFGVLILMRTDMVRLISGNSTPLGTSVLIVFSVVWMLNVPFHGLAILLIARGRQRSFTNLVIIEVIVNIAVTVPSVFIFGGIGAAFTSLAVITISNGLVLPIFIKSELAISPMEIIWKSSFPYTILGLAASFAGSYWFFGQTPGILRITLALATSCAVGAIAGYFLLGRSGRHQLETLLRSRKAGTAGPKMGKSTNGGFDQ